MARMVMIILCMVSLVWIFYVYRSGNASGADACRRCHEDVWREARASPFRHSVVEKNCATCHIIKEPARPWLRIVSPGFQKDCIIKLADSIKDGRYSLKVTARDRLGRSSTTLSMDFVTHTIDELAEDRTSLPEIEELKLEEIQHKVFVEATLYLRTNVHTQVVVQYGPDEGYGYRVSSGEFFSKEHRLRLVGLSKGKLYHFKVIAKDIFGNTVDSEDHTFSTSATLKRTGYIKEEDTSMPVIKEVQLFRGRNHGLYLMALSNKPLRMMVSIREEEETEDPHGYGFLPPEVSAIKVCVKCHPQGISHPVGISSRGVDIRIPPNLPTIRRGIITCVTCHKPHGGNRRYFARLDFERDICIECHIAKPFL